MSEELQSEGLEVEEVARLREALTAAQRKLTALDAGVAPELVDDAVVLAAAAGAEDFAEAIAGVLQRHPDWSADRQRGKFQLGIDPDRPVTTREAPQNTKRWNRFK